MARKTRGNIVSKKKKDLEGSDESCGKTAADKLHRTVAFSAKSARFGCTEGVTSLPREHRISMKNTRF